MKVLLLSNEYPPNIYGGAGVHVDYLSREISKLMDVEVRCFGNQNATRPHLRAKGTGLAESFFTRCPKELKSALLAAQRCVHFASDKIDADLVHCHTWYTHLGGILAKLNYGIPLVITTHSLEPLRPWKREQLGHSYDFSVWVEKTALEMADAVVAVSSETKKDILKYFSVKKDKIKVIYNGIDVDEYSFKSSKKALIKYGIDPLKPYVLFVGRITRQKGIIHLVNAIPELHPSAQIVLCAGAPDTKEIAVEMEQAVKKVQANRKNIHWIQEMVPKKDVMELYSHASVFCCPSIYEPFGIINLEAMACHAPVVASAVGGIKEVVVPESTGILVPVHQMNKSPFEPLKPKVFSHDLASAINRVLLDESLRRKFIKNGRKRVEELFSWKSIALQTVELYKSLQKPEGRKQP